MDRVSKGRRGGKRRGGKREGAGRKKSPALTKITREIDKKKKNLGEQITIIYVWKIAFSQSGKRFVRRESQS